MTLWKGNSEGSYKFQSMAINPFPNKFFFITSVLKTLWEKEKLLVTSNFFFSHTVFYPFEEHFATLIKSEIVVCKLFEIGGVLNLSFGKGFKEF